MVTPEEIQKADEAWRKAYCSLIMAHRDRIAEGKEFSAHCVQSRITTIKALKVPPLRSVEVKGITKTRGNSKQMHLIAEPLTEGYSGSVMTTCTYTKVKPSSGRLGVCLRSLSAWEIQITVHTVIARVQTANVVPQCGS